MKIGFLGIGSMGAAIAPNLVRAGHAVSVWNRSPNKAEALVEKGALHALTPAEASRAEVVFTMLADDAAVEGVADDIIANLADGGIHISLSTISVALAEKLTAANTGLVLTIAANYGGRWDLMQAMNRMQLDRPELAGKFEEQDLAPYLSMHYAPEPDLFIRTGGEERISNFLLWQLAYSELYFTDTLWPDFNQKAFSQAIKSYQSRERRFGRTSEQLTDAASGEKAKHA